VETGVGATTRISGSLVVSCAAAAWLNAATTAAPSTAPARPGNAEETPHHRPRTFARRIPTHPAVMLRGTGGPCQRRKPPPGTERGMLCLYPHAENGEDDHGRQDGMLRAGARRAGGLCGAGKG